LDQVYVRELSTGTYTFNGDTIIFSDRLFDYQMKFIKKDNTLTPLVAYWFLSQKTFTRSRQGEEVSENYLEGWPSMDNKYLK